MTATQTLGGVYEIVHIDSGSIAILTIAIAEVGLETHKLIQSFPRQLLVLWQDGTALVPWNQQCRLMVQYKDSAVEES